MMKINVIFVFIFLVSSAGKNTSFKILINSFCFYFLVLSNAGHKPHLYDIVHKTVSKDSETIILEIRPHKSGHLTITTTTSPTTTTTEQPDIIESEEEIKIQTRESWDSGEDNYFKWAALNRRPMESLAGRKRSLRKYKKHLE